MAKEPDLTTQEKKEVERMFTQGLSVAQIVKELNRSETAIRRVLKNSGHDMVGNKITKTEVERILTLYYEGHSVAEIARLTQRGKTTIRRVLKQNNIVLKFFKKDFSEEEIYDMVSMYNNHKSSKEISAKYQISDDTVLSILREAGIKIRSRQYRLSGITNHHYFETIDVQEKAYFLGIVITDGSVSDVKISANSSQKLSIQLQERDAYILREFKRQLGGHDDVIRLTNRGEAYFNVSSQQLCNDLAKYGVIPRKTGYEILPTIDDEWMPHLIRSIFDGDGCACLHKNNRLSVDICGSLALCQGVKEYLMRTIGVNDNKIYTRKNQNIHILSFAERRDVWNFYHLIYKDSRIHLERKKQKFIQFFESRNMKYDPYAVGITCHTSTKPDPISIR